MKLLFIFDFFSNTCAYLDNHSVKIGDFSSLFEVVLGGSLALLAIPKVRNLLDNFITPSKNTPEEQFADLGAEMDLFGAKITSMLGNPRNLKGTDSFKYFVKLTKQRKEYSNKKEGLINNSIHNFYILSLYCFFMLIIGTVEGGIAESKEFCLFKNYLVAFNFLFILYQIYESLFIVNEVELNAKLYYHTINTLLFFLVAILYCYIQPYQPPMYIIMFMTLMNLLLPLLLIMGNYYLLQQSLEKHNYIETSKEAISSINKILQDISVQIKTP